jgi:putative transposase
MKRRNPKFGCVRIAQQINHAFGIKIDKDVVRRVLAIHFRPERGADGPSRLTLIAHAKDSLWCVALFRVESILLRSHWVMLVMDVCTRRIIGFGVAHASIDGMSVCRMFNCATAGNPNRNTSVRITIHSFVFTGGLQTCACWRSRKLNRFRAVRFHIRSSNV